MYSVYKMSAYCYALQSYYVAFTLSLKSTD